MTESERMARWLSVPGNREKKRAYQKAYRAANADRIRELNRIWTRKKRTDPAWWAKKKAANRKSFRRNAHKYAPKQRASAARWVMLNRDKYIKRYRAQNAREKDQRRSAHFLDTLIAIQKLKGLAQ